MYSSRLGQHFEFQGAQRIAVARIEEECLQSGGKKWLMLIDKIDQNAAYLPTVWELLRTAFFKGGERLQVSLNGAWFFGPRQSPELLVRTMFEDCKHGSNMQASTLLMNLHDRALQEKVLPEEWFINADNTYKETKNNQCMHFMMWLLINLEGTSLWRVNFVFLLVGHTHNKLYRFFSIVKKALQGHTYFTREDLIRRLHEGIHGLTFDFAHLTDVWNWYAMQKACDMPHINDTLAAEDPKHLF